MNKIDYKTVGGWIIAILLSGFTAFATSKQQSEQHTQQLENRQTRLEEQVGFLRENQKEILQTVKDANNGINEIKIQLNTKADKQWKN